MKNLAWIRNGVLVLALLLPLGIGMQVNANAYFDCQEDACGEPYEDVCDSVCTNYGSPCDPGVCTASNCSASHAKGCPYNFCWVTCTYMAGCDVSSASGIVVVVVD